MHFLILYERCHLVVIEKNVIEQIGMASAGSKPQSIFQFFSGFYSEYVKHVLLINIHYFFWPSIYFWVQGITEWKSTQSHKTMLRIPLSNWVAVNTDWKLVFQKTCFKTICVFLEWDLFVELCNFVPKKPEVTPRRSLQSIGDWNKRVLDSVWYEYGSTFHNFI